MKRARNRGKRDKYSGYPGRPQCKHCGKISYISRKSAREAAKTYHPNDRMSTYKCVKAPEYVDTNYIWHIGHLDESIVKGEVERSEHYGTGALHPSRLDVEYDIINENDKDND